MKSTAGYPVWDMFTSPGIYTRKMGPAVFNVSSDRHRQLRNKSVLM